MSSTLRRRTAARWGVALAATAAAVGTVLAPAPAAAGPVPEPGATAASVQDITCPYVFVVAGWYYIYDGNFYYHADVGAPFYGSSQVDGTGLRHGAISGGRRAWIPNSAIRRTGGSCWS